MFAEDGLAVPGGSGADELCPAESGEERGGEGGAGGRAAETPGRDGEGTGPEAAVGLVGLAELPGPTLLGGERESPVVMSLAVLSADPAGGCWVGCRVPAVRRVSLPNRV